MNFHTTFPKTIFCVILNMQTQNAAQGFSFRSMLNRNSLSIVLWNLFPVIGVLFWGWQPISIFVCYALETIVVGVFNVFKLIAVYRYGLPDPPEQKGIRGLGIIRFFIFHYFFFVFGQLTLFFSINMFAFTGPLNAIHNLHAIMLRGPYQIALLAFIINNTHLFIYDFCFYKKYKMRTMVQQMFEPYPRIFVQQFVVILGCYIFKASGNDYAVLIVFVLAKIFFDLLFHSLSMIQMNKAIKNGPED
jgi:hypothetical protein